MRNKHEQEQTKDARLKALDLQLEAAVVDGPDDEGYFDVFVPGAISEQNRVSGTSEEEAKEGTGNMFPGASATRSAERCAHGQSRSGSRVDDQRGKHWVGFHSSTIERD